LCLQLRVCIMQLCVCVCVLRSALLPWVVASALLDTCARVCCHGYARRVLTTSFYAFAQTPTHVSPPLSLAHFHVASIFTDAGICSGSACHGRGDWVGVLQDGLAVREQQEPKRVGRRYAVDGRIRGRGRYTRRRGSQDSVAARLHWGRGVATSHTRRCGRRRHVYQDVPPHRRR